MQYKVPQNIDMEDRIVGPFTVKQFTYLLVSGAIIYGWWNHLQSNYVDFTVAFVAIALPVGSLGLALALVKINDRPFEYFLLNLLRFVISPKHHKWQSNFQEKAVIIIDKEEKKRENQKKMDLSSADLDQLAQQLENSAAIMQEKQSRSVPQKTIQEIQEKGVDLNISVKNQPQETETTPVQPNSQSNQSQSNAPTAVKQKKIFGIFG